MSASFVECMEGGRCELAFHPLHPGVELFLGIVALCPYSVWMEFFLNAENYRAPGISYGPGQQAWNFCLLTVAPLYLWCIYSFYLQTGSLYHVICGLLIKATNRIADIIYSQYLGAIPPLPLHGSVLCCIFWIKINQDLHLVKLSHLLVDLVNCLVL